MALRSPSVLLKDSFEFYKSHFALLTTIAAVPAVLQAISAFLMPAAPGVPAEANPLGVLIAIAAAFISILATAALVLAISNPSGHSTAKSAFMEAKKHFFPFLWVAILSGLAIALGFIALIIPGVILMVWFLFAYFTLLLEGKKGVDALKASKAHVKGKWFDVFIRLLVLIVVCMIASVIVGIVVGMIIWDKGAHQAVMNLLSAIYMPFALTYVYLIYQDVRSTQIAPAAAVTPTPTPTPSV